MKSIASFRLISPALLTRISTFPKASSAPFTITSIADISERSAITSANSPPSASISFLVSSQDLLATPTTLAPACASATDIPCPRPVFAPVTTATFPSSLNASIIDIYSSPSKSV